MTIQTEHDADVLTALELLRQHHADGDDFGTDAALTICRAMNEIARLREIEARAERLEAALNYIAESHDAGRYDGHPEPCPAHDEYQMWLAARDALADKPKEADDDDA